MLYIFLNPKKKINGSIIKLIENANIEFDIFYPETKKDLEMLKINNKESTLLSILSKVIFPNKFLDRFKYTFNIHPGTKDYPGFGYNFALLNNAIEYGAVCHFMEEKIDSGDIILESNFVVSENESIDTLQFKTYLHILTILSDFLDNYKSSSLESLQKIKWTRPPYLKKDFLNTINQINDPNLKHKFTHYPDNDLPIVEKYF
tara:strand:+ start:892 stop:1500 length:609 start_codon:yes stop_codon:yes gene_type:complete